MGFIFGKNGLIVLGILVLIGGTGCQLTTPKKEYTVIRETTRGPSQTTQSVVPIYDAAGNLVQRGVLVQPVDGKPYVQGMGGMTQPQALPLQNVQGTMQQTVSQGGLQSQTPVASQKAEVPSAQNQVYLSPVTGQVLTPVPEVQEKGQAAGQTSSPQMPVQQGYVPVGQGQGGQAGGIRSPSPVETGGQTGMVPGQGNYTGQTVPLSVQAQPVAAKPSQAQIQRQLGMSQTPMQADIVQSYASCPYVVVLQHPVERNLVKCLMCDQVCLHQFAQAGYVQVRYLPQSSGARDIADPTDYPAGRWRPNQEVPRW